MHSSAKTRLSWLDHPIPFLNKTITTEILLFGIIILLAILSRITGLGIRALSHDESIHLS
jgi:hypothetical protein